jgi:hypothetical protein
MQASPFHKEATASRSALEGGWITPEVRGRTSWPEGAITATPTI